MPPVVILAATFLIWIIARGEGPKYWGFATVKNSRDPALNRDTAASGGAMSPAVAPPQIPALDILPPLAF